MSLMSEKTTILSQIGRYMSLLSNLKTPPVDYIEDLDYLRGLVQSANKSEIAAVKATWLQLAPKDRRSAEYIKTGVLNG